LSIRSDWYEVCCRAWRRSQPSRPSAATGNLVLPYPELPQPFHCHPLYRDTEQLTLILGYFGLQINMMSSATPVLLSAALRGPTHFTNLNVLSYCQFVVPDSNFVDILVRPCTWRIKAKCHICLIQPRIMPMMEDPLSRSCQALQRRAFVYDQELGIHELVLVYLLRLSATTSRHFRFTNALGLHLRAV
jgi:hypothetical protein